MNRIAQRILTILILSAGVAMVVWGGQALMQSERPDPPVAHEEVGPRMCPPTFGEIMEIGPLSRKLGSLALTIAGAAVAYFSLLSLVQKREHS